MLWLNFIFIFLNIGLAIFSASTDSHGLAALHVLLALVMLGLFVWGLKLRAWGKI
jgi:hypothetical protein